MQWKMLFVFFVVLFQVSSTQANQDVEGELSSVTVFSHGFNGFIAKKMPEQKLYEEALKRKDSTEFFETILGDPHSTPESKLYAACGLWENKQQEKIHLNKEFLKLDVSILQADILRKENLVTVLSRIKQHGCK